MTRAFSTPEPSTPAAGSTGFATLMAVAMVGLMAMALTVMAWRLNEEMGNAKSQATRQQIDQLLVAGAIASLRLLAENLESLEPALPSILVERGARVTVRLLPPGTRVLEKHVEVEARYGWAVGRQYLLYVQGSRGWGLVGASLKDPKPSSGGSEH